MPQVVVRGVKPLLRDLKQISSELPRDVRKGNLRIAQDIAARAKQRASGLGGVHAHVASGIRAGATQTSGRVTLDAGQQPAIFGAEFGGRRRRTTRQFPPWRGSGGGAGYFLYPTIRRREQQIVEAYVDMLDDVLRRGGGIGA